MRQEMMGFGEGSGISWTTCKQSAPRSSQITTRTPHHSIFHRPDVIPGGQPTVSKHWRHVGSKYLWVFRAAGERWRWASWTCRGRWRRRTLAGTRGDQPTAPSTRSCWSTTCRCSLPWWSGSPDALATLNTSNKTNQRPLRRSDEQITTDIRPSMYICFDSVYTSPIFCAHDFPQTFPTETVGDCWGIHRYINTYTSVQSNLPKTHRCPSKVPLLVGICAFMRVHTQTDKTATEWERTIRQKQRQRNARHP